MTIISGVRYTGPIVGGRRQGGSAAVDPYSLFNDDFGSGPADPLDRGWSYFNSAVLASATVTAGALRNLPTQGGSSGSFWYNDRTGYLIYKTIGALQIDVRQRQRVTNTAGSGLPGLGGGTTYRLTGLAAHNPDRTVNLNYVHNAAGVAAGVYSFESKSTLNSISTFPVAALPAVYPWTIDTRLVRDGDDWTSYYRNEPAVALESDDGWVTHTTFSRPDLPTELQWGFMAYASGTTADIVGWPEEIRFASL